MNVHDSERLAGLLEAAGYQRAADGADADVVVFNTCAVRENADNKLYGNLSHLAPRKRGNPDMQIAVGGCLAQKDRDTVLRKAPWVDVVFGTHNIGSLPTLLDRARHNNVAQVEIAEACSNFRRRCRAPANPPMRLGFPSPSGATTAAPSASSRRCGAKRSTAARPTSWPRCRSLVDDGVLEVTLLGQNVNAYGVSFADPALPRNRGAFAELLRACGRHRRAGTGAVHLAASGRVHRRRHRGDGADAECLPRAAHAAAVRVGPGTARDAAVLPRRALSGHHRTGPGCHAARRDHHRSDRRFPR